MRILVVDDEDTLRTIISEVLVDDGHDVVQASGGEEALAAFREQPFPIVVTDVIMGKMNGLQLLDEIKLIRPSTLVIIMTSHASIEAATAALRSGAYDFLIKPFEDLNVISAVVSRAAEKILLKEDNLRLIIEMKKKGDEMERLNKRLQKMANRDGLTGLYNHRYFRDALNMEVSRSQRHGRSFSLIFSDLDHFKKYNDTHGHLAGDQLLKELSHILTERCRATTTVARYGGEEFVLLLPETDKEGALRLAQDLRERVEIHEFAGRETQPLGRITLSIGVASFPEDGKDDATLIRCADEALYKAKSSGRNRVVAAAAALVR